MANLVTITRDTIYGNTQGVQGIFTNVGNDAAVTYKPIMISINVPAVVNEMCSRPVVYLHDDEFRIGAPLVRAEIRGLYNDGSYDGTLGFVEDPDHFDTFGLLQFYPDSPVSALAMGWSGEGIPSIYVERDEFEVLDPVKPMYGFTPEEL